MHQHYADDLRVLATRALVGKTVTAFGIDGNGQYGTSDTPQTYKIAFISSGLVSDKEGWICAALERYSHRDFGHVATDANLRISLNQLFTDCDIDSTCWSWAGLDEQGDDYFVIRVDVRKMIDWP